MHPMWRQEKLRETSGDHKTHVSAYSPLGGPGNVWGLSVLAEHPIVKSIAHKHNATPGKILGYYYSPLTWWYK